jgi:hypothetical protein
MMDVTLLPDDVINRIVAKEPGVRATVRAKAVAMTGTANARLAPHRKSGMFHVIAEHNRRGDNFRKYDSFVTLAGGPGEDAYAAEFGHINSGRYRHLAPRRVGGIHILRDTIAAHRAF